MEAAPQLYEVTGELVTIGRKHITVRCPRTMKAMIDAKLQWLPVAEYFRRIKDEEDSSNTVTLFNLRVLDKNFRPAPGEQARTFDVRLVTPPSIVSSFKMDELLGIPYLSGDSAAAIQYIQDVSDLLACWFPTMSTKREDPTSPVSFRHLDSARMNLKWPWKVPLADFLGSFNPDLSIHMIDMGLGYFSQKNSSIGISLRLSQFPALTKAGAYLAKVQQSEKSAKKRKVTSLDANGDDVAEVTLGSDQSSVEVAPTYSSTDLPA